MVCLVHYLVWRICYVLVFETHYKYILFFCNAHSKKHETVFFLFFYVVFQINHCTIFYFIKVFFFIPKILFNFNREIARFLYQKWSWPLIRYFTITITHTHTHMFIQFAVGPLKPTFSIGFQFYYIIIILELTCLCYRQEQSRFVYHIEFRLQDYYFGQLEGKLPLFYLHCYFIFCQMSWLFWLIVIF